MVARALRRVPVRSATWSVVAAVAGALACAQVSTAASAPAMLAVSPAQASAGSAFSVTVTGMPARRVGTVWLGSVHLASLRFDRHGKGAATLRIPRGTRAGQARLRVAAGTRTVRGTLTVARFASAVFSEFVALSTGESARLSPTRVHAGASIRVRASGFRPRAIIQAWFRRRRIAIWRANRRGALRSSVSLPRRTRAAAYVLTIRSMGRALSFRLVVRPSIRGGGGGAGGGSSGNGGSSGGTTGGPFSGALAPTIAQIADQMDTLQAAATKVTPSWTGDVTSFSATGLPLGLQIDPGTGTISGTPGASGTWSTTVTAAGPAGRASTTFSWTIVAPPVVDAVGDMACSAGDPNYNGGLGTPNATSGNDCLQKYVSDLVVGTPMLSALLDLGDNQYDTGSLSDYQTVFGSTFGRANGVTYPALGNAEYGAEFSSSAPQTPSGFFSYFSSANVFQRIAQKVAGPFAGGGGGDTSHMTTGGYYSFNLGTWHVIALNSNCFAGGVAGGCGAGSPEEQWLKSDLAANRQRCILAYWHHPLYSAIANSTAVRPFWTDLSNAHATLVLNGHGNHHYERFAPQDASGTAAPGGIREFIVSTGGMNHGVIPGTPAANSQASNYDTFGILRLSLFTDSYSWQFVPAADGEPGNFTDSGSGNCS